MSQKPYLNLGCGRITLPAPRPLHHSLVNEAIYAYPLWHNVDRNEHPGVDECVDIFRYPWPFADNSFDGALLSHIAEHIPHEIRLNDVVAAAVVQTPLNFLPNEWRANGTDILAMQDGWYAFFSELHRVLTNGAIVHVLAPYAWSQGAVTDPTHTRLLTEHTFIHNMKPEPDAPFEYAKGAMHFEMDDPAVYHVTEMFNHLRDDPTEFTRALQTRINVAYEFMVKLRVVK